MKELKARNLSAELQLAADHKGNGTLKQIFLAAGKTYGFDVHIWPSTSPADAAFRRGVAYARSCFYLEDKYLVTPQNPAALQACISLYNRMRAGVHACLVEHGVTSSAGEKLLNDSAQVLMWHFGNEAFKARGWQQFAESVDAQVRKIGGGPVLPARKVSPCTDDSAHEADRALLARLNDIGIGEVDVRSKHLSIVKPAPGPT